MDTIVGTIMNYRQGRHLVKPHHMLLKFPGYDDAKTATQLLGHKVYWESPAGKIISGSVVSTHGTQGVVRAIFKKNGLPGQSLGQYITLKK